MDDRLEWFAPKRYGYGSGVPISWQGWAVTLAYLGTVILLVVTLRRHGPLQFIAALVPVTVVFGVICARTTKGGWRWRWGEEDDV
jgi:hypothetical protein